MPGTFLIRDYVSGDWDVIAHVHDRARLDELWLTVGVDAFRPLAEIAHDEGLFDGTLCVAVLDGVVSGFIATDAGEIAWLYTDPDLYRRGIARRLLRHAIALWEGEMRVSVLVGNDPALALYRSEGFEIVETRDGNLQCFDDFPARGHILRRGPARNTAQPSTVDKSR
ncbi:GNAT family N-acetyltransferase [Sphingomonas cavernae]|uniref:GNAT family N-acetyltransferase n=1 Tax=Sphingomonas cavernae TaxID=2320861 RepID=A0A418W7I1_9SPHN|nr:GNAT family N-acetyltransferase [Sphingomonas cavernae]RJF85894.1 GNAT family N-acetyltransferase [Sphingomonas cavernae]